MATFREKHDPIRVFWKRLGMAALLALVIMAASGVWNVYHKDRESRALRVQSEIELAHLEQQQTQLNTQITKLESPRGKEETLRQQYAVGKQGERMIIIVDPEESKAVPATTTPGAIHWIESLFHW
jgi:cell division protein FtsB